MRERERERERERTRPIFASHKFTAKQTLPAGVLFSSAISTIYRVVLRDHARKFRERPCAAALRLSS